MLLAVCIPRARRRVRRHNRAAFAAQRALVGEARAALLPAHGADARVAGRTVRVAEEAALRRGAVSSADAGGREKGARGT